MKKRINFLKTLPKKRIAVGALFFNKDNEVLILKDSFKNSWTLPGGCLEKSESPIQGLTREIKEEIGLDLKIKKCLVVDYTNNKHGNYQDECLKMLFLGEKLTSNQIKKIKIDNKEIIDYKFIKLKDTSKYVFPVLARRIMLGIKDKKDCIFLENGKRVL